MRRAVARWSSLLLSLQLAGACLRATTAAAQLAPVAPVPPPAGAPASQVGAAPAEQPAPAPDAAPGAGDPPPEVHAEYRDVVARAIAEFAAGRWAEARSLFLRAHALWPSARTLRSLGMTSFELRSYGRALVELQAALDDSRRPLSAEQRAQVMSLIEQTRAFVGRYRVRLSPVNASLVVDGAARVLPPDGVLLLGVGRHELLARAEGHTELRRTLDVEGIEDEDLTLALQPLVLVPAPPMASEVAGAQRPHAAAETTAEGGRLWTWVAGGAALALAVASTALWFESKSEFDKLAAACETQTCTRGELDTSSVEVPETAHQITLGLAIGAGVGAIALFFLEGSADPKAHAGVSIGLGAVGAHGRF